MYYVLRTSIGAYGAAYSRDYLATHLGDQKFADSVVMAREGFRPSTLVARDISDTPPYMALAHEVAHILDPDRNSTSDLKVDDSHFPYVHDGEKLVMAVSGERTNLLTSGAGWIRDGWGYRLTATGNIERLNGLAQALTVESPIFDSRRLTRSQEIGDFETKMVNGQPVVTQTRFGMRTGHIDLLHGG